MPDTQQRAFEFEAEARVSQSEPEPGSPVGVRFQEGQQRLFIGNVPLEQYLEHSGLKAVRALKQWLEQLDMRALERAYKPGGRPPLHPRLMLGLILYGIHLKQWSLRELEQLAIRDVGAWWLCGGLQPDHSTLGKFLVRHEKVLSDEFFVSATRQLAQQLGLKEGEAAADGTVIQAVAGLRSLAKKEVLEAEAREARQAAQAGEQQQVPRSEQAPLEKKAQQLEKAVEIATERAQERAERRQSAPQVSRQEPQAVNQPGKDGLYRLSYKPSVLVHSGGLIVGQAVDATSEVGVLPGLLQHSQQVGVVLQSLALDTGYFQLQVLQLAVELQLDVLCPPKHSPRNTEGVPVTRRKLFAKAAFRYDAQADCYWCPAGQKMEPGQWKVEADTKLRVRHYGTPACKGCPLRAQCTSSQSAPRKIGRYEGEELKEAMAQVLEHPQARKRYARRSPLVEPVFAELKERQGLKRFHRRGLRGARLEFSLHCLAFNLKRAGPAVVVLWLRCRSPAGAVLWLGLLAIAFF
ncbi:IS1182 family transposase [Hyalangium versicolor]|uniref:IS1182 family transposase n=1 Tax=Hyalangium versicolor TaxID=2861190 RepID=UPI001CCB43D3|nr:IS1182 family transposase [Hyalangium versicolor]